jgi:hypothetical protein
MLLRDIETAVGNGRTNPIIRPAWNQGLREFRAFDAFDIVLRKWNADAPPPA